MKPCGTDAAYYRHRRNGEVPCDACREAHNAKSRQWNKANPEKKAQLRKAWRQANPERTRELGRRHDARRRAADPEGMRARARESHRRNRSARIEATRQRRKVDPHPHRDEVKAWRADNPEKAREINRRAQARRRARLQNAVVVPFTAGQLDGRLSMFVGCWMCGGAATEWDHVIPLARGGPHCLSNLRPACRSCNASKGAADWRDVA